VREKLIEIKKRCDEIECAIAQGDFLTHAREYKRLAPIAQAFDQLTAAERDLQAACELGMAEEAVQAQIQIEEANERLRGLMQPRDDRDDSNVILEIRPAAGGDEAALFAAELLRMYNLYAASLGFRVEVNDLQETGIGGIKEVSATVIGDGAFARFKYESGVHRVQRVPDTETQGRIHTSTCTVAVLPEAMTVDFKIDERDLKIDTYRSGGAGGQHVNKTESAIRITHLPTGTVVTCQDGRSQLKNREKAMLILQTKLADHYQSAADAKYAAARKIQVGTGDRSERIRTYNFPQDRVTDHRINFMSYFLPGIINGAIDIIVEALCLENMQRKLEDGV